MIDILLNMKPNTNLTKFEPVVIDDIKVDDTTAEAKTLKELLPSVENDFNLETPIKDKTLIAFIRLIYEASKKSSNTILTTKRFCFSLDKARMILNTTIEHLKGLVENGINFKIIYYNDEESGDFEAGHWIEQAGYEDETCFISMINDFTRSHRTEMLN